MLAIELLKRVSLPPSESKSLFQLAKWDSYQLTTRFQDNISLNFAPWRRPKWLNQKIDTFTIDLQEAWVFKGLAYNFATFRYHHFRGFLVEVVLGILLTSWLIPLYNNYYYFCLVHRLHPLGFLTHDTFFFSPLKEYIT